MNNTQSATRKQASLRYAEALKRWNTVATDSEFAAADAELTAARRDLVQAEISSPTNSEVAKKSRELSSRNRGWGW